MTYAAVLDVILSWKAQWSMSFHVKLRYILKVVSAAAWVIILPVTYAYTWENPPGFAQTIKSWFGNNSNSPSLFILAVVIYLSPNMLAGVLFLFPFIRRFLERSNYRIVMLMMWWSQVSKFLLFPQLLAFWDFRLLSKFLAICSLVCTLAGECMRVHFPFLSKNPCSDYWNCFSRYCHYAQSNVWYFLFKLPGILCFGFSL